MKDAMLEISIKLTGEEEEEEISEEDGVAASGSDVSVDSDFESIFF